jgi:hypothetical protein
MHEMKPTYLISLFCLVIASWTLPAAASTAVRLDFDQLTTRADRVVVAELLDKHSDWDSSGRRIETRFRFRVLQDLAGSGEPEIAIVQPGGTVGRWTQRTDGYVDFDGSGPQVLFLRQAAAGLQSVGMCQGVFRIHQDGDRTLFVQRLEGLHFAGDSGRPLILASEAAIRRIEALFSARSRP